MSDYISRYFLLALAVIIAFFAISLAIITQHTGKVSADHSMTNAREAATEDTTSLINLEGLTIPGMLLEMYIEKLEGTPHVITTKKNPTGFTALSKNKDDINYVSDNAFFEVRLVYSSTGEIVEVRFEQGE